LPLDSVWQAERMSLTRPVSSARAAVLVAASCLVLSGCTGDGKDPVSEGKSPEEVMELAKQTLDETSGVEIDLSGELPDGVTGLSGATGLGTHDPLAFQGSASVTAGLSLTVDVIAIEDDVWIAFPGQDFRDADPGDYGAPNPAALFATEGGISDLLVKTEGLEEGDPVRGGDNNEETFTEYTGTVPADLVENVIPSATGDDFDVAYLISDEGELREARITGEFYPDSDEMTYTIELDDYGTQKDITAP
jgi:lipoprotein LprG